jgi:hypothetical protein
MNLALLIVASFAVWRVSRLIALEEGPFSVFAWLRGRIDPNQQTWIGRGISCVPCISFWVALIAALLLQLSVTEWLGLAGAVLLINRWAQ